MFGNLKLEDDDQTFMRCGAAIDHDRSISDEVRLQLRVKYLVIAHQFLKTHAKPEGKSFSNVAPPDGGMPGQAPSEVKDPVLRAKYEKMIAKNNALSDAQNKYSRLFRKRELIADTLAQFINLKKENLKIVFDLLNQTTRPKEETKELMDLIDQASVKKGMKIPVWAESINK